MTNFTPWSALGGGALIGISASVLLLLNGQVAGISGILGGLVRPRAGETSWRALFIVGLLVGGVVLYLVRPASFGAAPVSIPLAIVAGVFVGGDVPCPVEIGWRRSWDYAASLDSSIGSGLSVAS